jgi:hypothetical protein
MKVVRSKEALKSIRLDEHRSHRFSTVAVFSCCCKIFGSTVTLSFVFGN